LTEEETIFIFKELKDTILVMLDTANYFNIDIKPDNIMIHNNNIKIIDFRFTREFTKEDLVFLKKK